MFDASFGALIRAVDRIRQQLETADEELTAYLAEELGGLQDLGARFLDQWLALDEQIRDLQAKYGSDTTGSPEMRATMSALSRTNRENTGQIRGSWPIQPLAFALDEAPFDLSEPMTVALRKGIGFYDLLMFDEAAEALETALSHTEEPTARLYLAAAYVARNRPEAANTEVARVRAVTKHPKLLAAAAEIEAHIHLLTGDMELATRSLLDIISSCPDYIDAWYNLGLCYLALRDPIASERMLLHVVAQQPEDMEALEWLAYAQLQGKASEAAWSTCKQALQLAPMNPDLLMLYSLACQATERFEAGHQASRRLHSTHPTKPEGFLHTAWYALQRGQLAAATLILKRLLSIHPNHPKGLMWLGIVQMLQGETASAKRLLLRALVGGPDKSAIQTALGQLDARANRKCQA